VSPGESVRDRDRDAQHLAERHSLPGNEPVQALAGHVLHDDEVTPVRGLDLVDRDDVRVVQGGGGAGLLDEASPTLFVHPLRWKDLDGDLAAETRVKGAVDLAHSPRTQQGQDLVRPEPRAGLQCHGRLAEALAGQL